MSECPVIQMSPEPFNLVGMMKSSDVGFTPRLIQLALWRDGIVRTERIRVKILKRAAESQATLFTEGRIISHRDSPHSSTSYTVETRANTPFLTTLSESMK